MNKHGLVDHDIFFGKLLVNWLGPIVAMTHERRLQLEHFISFSSPGEYQANGLKVNQIELMTTGCSSAIFHQDEISEFITTQLLEKLNPECIHLSQIKVIDNVRSNFALALLDQSNLSKLKRFLQFGWSINPHYPLSRYKGLFHSVLLSFLNWIFKFGGPSKSQTTIQIHKNKKRA